MNELHNALPTFETAENGMRANETAASYGAGRFVPSAIYRRFGDRVFALIMLAFGLAIIALALGMGFVLYTEGRAPISQTGFFGFMLETRWNPVSGVHGAWPFLLGTVITSASALALAFFPAVGVGIFTAEYAPRKVGAVINYLVDLLAAVPSVVIGIWGIFVFAPWMRDTFYIPVYNRAVESAPALVPLLGAPASYNIITATLLLALMVTPYTVALTRDAIKLVPPEQRDAAWALGATHWEVMRLGILPYARGGIVAGAILSLARALGETMVVAMLIGNSNRLPFTFFGPASTMPSVIANEFREAVEVMHLASLMAVGFYLFLLTFVVNLIAAFIQRRLNVGGRVL